MKSALHITTKILPGNIEVIIMLPDKPQPPNRRVLETPAAAHKLGSFRTSEEIDRDLQIERDSWGLPKHRSGYSSSQLNN